MRVRWIAALLCVLAAVPVGARAEPEASPMTAPPELVVAVLVDGRTLEIRRFVEGWVRRTNPSKVEVSPGYIGPATEVVPIVETHITRIDAATVVARRVDGRAVSSRVLMGTLARPTPVLLVQPWRQLDPLFSQMFKPELLVLVLPREGVPPTVAPAYTAPTDRRQ
jgi:hypothetical protein